MEKVYLGQVERFGYVLTAVGRTEKEVKDALLKEYRKAYKDINGIDPKTDVTVSGRPFQEVFLEELDIEEMEFGKVVWL